MRVRPNVDVWWEVQWQDLRSNDDEFRKQWWAAGEAHFTEDSAHEQLAAATEDKTAGPYRIVRCQVVIYSDELDAKVE